MQGTRYRILSGPGTLITTPATAFVSGFQSAPGDETWKIAPGDIYDLIAVVTGTPFPGNQVWLTEVAGLVNTWENDVRYKFGQRVHHNANSGTTEVFQFNASGAYSLNENPTLRMDKWDLLVGARRQTGTGSLTLSAAATPAAIIASAVVPTTAQIFIKQIYINQTAADITGIGNLLIRYIGGSTILSISEADLVAAFAKGTLLLGTPGLNAGPTLMLPNVPDIAKGIEIVGDNNAVNGSIDVIVEVEYRE